MRRNKRTWVPEELFLEKHERLFVRPSHIAFRDARGARQEPMGLYITELQL